MSYKYLDVQRENGLERVYLADVVILHDGSLKDPYDLRVAAELYPPLSIYSITDTLGEPCEGLRTMTVGKDYIFVYEALVYTRTESAQKLARLALISSNTVVFKRFGVSIDGAVTID